MNLMAMIAAVGSVTQGAEQLTLNIVEVAKQSLHYVPID